MSAPKSHHDTPPAHHHEPKDTAPAPQDSAPETAAAPHDPAGTAAASHGSTPETAAAPHDPAGTAPAPRDAGMETAPALHGGGPAPLDDEPATAPALPAASTALMAQIDAERATMVETHRRTNIDASTIRNHHADIRRSIERGGTHLAPDAPAELPGFLAAYDASWQELEGATRAHRMGVTRAARYSVECVKARDLAAVEVLRFRDRVSKRVTAAGPVEDDCRLRAGVAAGLTKVSSPGEVDTAGNLQLDLLDDSKAIAVLETAGCYPQRVQKRLATLVGKLGAEIDAGLGEATRTGDASLLVNGALLKMQIVISRVEVFFDEFATADDVQKLEADVPRRYHGGATTTQPQQDPPTPPTPPGPGPGPSTEKEEKATASDVKAKDAEKATASDAKAKGEAKT